MKSLVYLVFAVLLISCGDDSKVIVEEATILEDTIDRSKIATVEPIDTLTNETVRLKKNSKPLVIARGSEPGWYAEFFSDHLRLLIDNGTDSLTIEKDFSDINSGNSYSTAIAESGNTHDKIMKTTAMAISIENKACTEEGSGEKREKSIDIKYNGKTYKGCATSKID